MRIHQILFCGLLLVYLCASNAFSAPIYSIDSIPDYLRTRAGAVIRNYESSYIVSNEDNLTYKELKAVSIFNESGLHEAEYAVYYDKHSSIQSIKATIYNEFGGLVQKISSNAFKDQSAVGGATLYGDSRCRHYEPAAISFPFTIVYELEMKRSQTLYFPKWMPLTANGVSLEKATLRFDTPQRLNIRYKNYNFSSIPDSTVLKDRLIYTWRSAPVAAIKPEVFSAGLITQIPYVLIAPCNFKYAKQRGVFNDWKGYGQWIYDELLRGRRTLSPETIFFIKQLTDSLPNDKAKAQAIYEFMQNKVRYISVQIGIGGFRPSLASEVDQFSYGDCKGLVNYTQALLDVVGIPSYYCVVNSGSFKQNIDASFASINDGDHVILAIPFPADTTWLECTSKTLPFGFLSDFTDDRLVVACTASGGKLLKTPKYAYKDNTQIRTANFSITANGTLTGDIHTVFSGCQYDNHIELNNLSEEKKEKLLLEKYTYPRMEVLDVRFKVNKSEKPSSLESFRMTSSGYVVKSVRDWVLQLNHANKSRVILSRIGVRNQNIYVNRGYTDIDNYTFNLPSNMKISQLPESVTVETPFGKYIARVIREGESLKYHRLLEIYEGTFDKALYADCINFFDKIFEADQMTIRLLGL